MRRIRWACWIAPSQRLRGPSSCSPLHLAIPSLIYHDSEEWNTPEAIQNASNPAYSIATDKFLWIQSVVVDGLDRVWALDTGRPRVDGSVLLAQVPGGPKLTGFYLNGTSFASYTFPAYVVFADSSLNDVRLDLRAGTGGYAYMTDNSPVRPGIVILDLETGVSWRHLDMHESVTVDPTFLPVYNGGMRELELRLWGCSEQTTHACSPARSPALRLSDRSPERNHSVQCGM